MLTALHDPLAAINITALLSRLRLLQRELQSQLQLKLASVTNKTQIEDGGTRNPGTSTELLDKLAARIEGGTGP